MDTERKHHVHFSGKEAIFAAMDDSEFEALFSLEKRLESSGVPIRIRHAIWDRICEDDDPGTLIAEFAKTLDSGVRYPYTDGEPARMTLTSEQDAFFMPPEEMCENTAYRQRVTLRADGRTYFFDYDRAGKIVGRSQKRLLPAVAKQMLLMIDSAVNTRFDVPYAKDAGSWKLEIKNSAGKCFGFEGSLFCFGWSERISTFLRMVLGRTDLLCFDGEAEWQERVAFVTFDGGEKEYCYLCEDKTILAGDTVRVPVGEHGRSSLATVTDVRYLTESESPYPLDDMKLVSEKIEKLPEGGDFPELEPFFPEDGEGNGD